MKLLKALVPCLLVASSAFATEPAIAPEFTMLRCVKDMRGSDGPYLEYLIHRVGKAPYEIVQYESFVPKGRMWATGVKRTVLTDRAECGRTEDRKITTGCDAPGLKFVLNHQINVDKKGFVTQVHSVTINDAKPVEFAKETGFTRDYCEIL